MKKKLKTELLSLYSDEGPERVGFIVAGKIHETLNISPEPSKQFMVPAEDILKYLISGKATATFHTHPNGTCNLSVDDYTAFLNYPEIQHIIIGKDGIRVYGVYDGAVIHQED